MSQRGIEPEKVTKPIQLVAAWFVTLILLVGAFLGAAATIGPPEWIQGLFGSAAVLAVPLFAWFVFRLQTRYRPELQEDVFYSKYKSDELALRGFEPENVINPSGSQTADGFEGEPIDLKEARDALYEKHRGLFLIHTWRPSALPGYSVDISIRIYEHGKTWTPISDNLVEKVEYFLGDNFFGGHSVIKTDPSDGYRLDISSHGSTNCVAKVYFREKYPSAILERYLDSNV